MGMTEATTTGVSSDIGAKSEFSQQQLGAAASKLISAAIGDVAVVYSRSPAHKHYSLADIEWMILPAVLTGQVYVAEAQDKATGHRAPVAVVLWANISAETDKRLTADAGQKLRLRPDEWKSGDILWIVDVAGDPRAIVAALKALLEGPFKTRDVKVVSAHPQSGSSVELLTDIVARAELATGGVA